MPPSTPPLLGAYCVCLLASVVVHRHRAIFPTVPCTAYDRKSFIILFILFSLLSLLSVGLSVL